MMTKLEEAIRQRDRYVKLWVTGTDHRYWHKFRKAQSKVNRLRHYREVISER